MYLNAICARRHAKDYTYIFLLLSTTCEAIIIILLAGKMRFQKIKYIDECGVVYRS